MTTHKSTLSNGLTVLLSPDSQQPQLVCRMAVRAGGARDPRERTGMAHFLEHLLCNKGTRRLGVVDRDAERPLQLALQGALDDLADQRGDAESLREQVRRLNAEAAALAIPNEHKQTCARLGVTRLNAATSHDRTVYKAQLPSNKLLPWLKLEADRFGQPVFRGFATERETIREELLRAVASPVRRLDFAVAAGLWGAHPYGTPVLGHAPHLDRISPGSAQTFFKRWYVPGNMALVIAGDMDVQRTTQWIEETLGQLPPGQAPAAPAPSLSPLPGVVRVGCTSPGERGMVMAWHTAPFGHPDHDALLMLRVMLSDGSTGLLERELVLPQRVRKAGAGLRAGEFAGAFKLYGTPLKDQSLEELEELLLEQVARVQRGELKRQDLDGARLNFRVSEQRRQESNQARADGLAREFAHGLPVGWTTQRTRRLDSVRVHDIVAVAQRYLGDRRVVGVRDTGDMPPAPPTPPSVPPLQSAAGQNSALFQELVQLPTPDLQPQVLRLGRQVHAHPLPSSTLLTAHNPYNDLFELSIRADLGTAQTLGWSHALHLAWRGGAGDLEAEALRTALRRRGLKLNLSCRRRDTQLVLSGPGEQLEPGLRLLWDRLRRPRLTEQERSLYLQDKVNRRADRKRARGLNASALRSAALYGDRSPYKTEVLDNYQLLALNLERSRPMLGTLAESSWQVSYSGRHAPEQLQALLQRDGVQPTPAPPPLRVHARARPQVFTLYFGSPQTLVEMHLPQAPLHGDRVPMNALLGEIFGGKAGLVFQEAREARGLGYVASGSYSHGTWVGDQGVLSLSVHCAPEKAAAAGQLLAELLDRPLDPARVQRAREVLQERWGAGRVRYRSVAPTMLKWARWGFEEDPRPGWLEALQRTHIDDLQAMLADRRRGHPVLCVVGDLDRVDTQGLGEVGAVTRHGLDDLLVW